MGIAVDVPGLIVLCLLAGLLYAGILYYRNPLLKDVPRVLRVLLFTFRFLLSAFICFYLLDPMIRLIRRETEKPMVIVAIDNSASLTSSKDSMYYWEKFPGDVRDLLASLSEKFDTATYTFGDKTRNGLEFTFSDKVTDMASLFTELDNRLTNRNIGAVILASDGIYNRGSNPLYSKTGIKAPIFSLALGDSTVRKDLLVRDVAHNRYAYLGNSFPLEVFVDARQLKGASSVLTVSRNGKVLFSEKIGIPAGSFSKNFPVMLDADQPGLHRYRIALSPVEGDLNLKNNFRDIFIEVLDSRQKILLLAQSPHPDINALRSAIERNKNYEVEVSTIEEFSKGFEAFNLVVLHQLPASNITFNKKLDPLWLSNLPVLFITGTQTDVVGLAKLNAGVKIPEHRNKSNEVMLHPAAGFSLFEVSPEAKNLFRKFPPLTAPFGTYKVSPSCVPLYNQRIGMVNTTNPAWAFADLNGRKTGLITGEGIWKWRLFEMAETGDTRHFDELVAKTVQYLAVKADKSLFRVYGKSDFPENESVEFNAEVYNKTYELINESEVTMVISNEEGKKYDFTFTPNGKSYRLNAGILPPGNYRYEARTKSGDEILTARGQFSITAIVLEQVNTTADHQLLYALSQKYKGELLYPSDMNKLPEMLSAREDVKTITYTHKQLSELIHIRWFFFILLSMLALEWVVRKQQGMY